MEHLIPQVWFDPLNTWLLILIALAAIAVLVKGADMLVDGASGLAYKIGMPKVIVGATIVSLGTTSPEAAVSVMAAWSGEAGLALGNAVGSIIADTGLIFGIGCLMAVLPADKFVLNRQGWVQFGSGVLLAAICYLMFCLDGNLAVLGRWVGLLFLGLLVGYLIVSVKWARQHPEGEPFIATDDVTKVTMVTGETESQAKSDKVIRLIALLVLGLVVVILSSRVLVCSATVVAIRLGIPQTVISATLIALGTSLPELATAISCIRKGHMELLVGNIIGADILNVLFVVGAAAVAAPLPIVENGNRIFLSLHLPTMLIILVLFRIFIFKAIRLGHFSRWMGVPLLVIYTAFVLICYLSGQH